MSTRRILSFSLFLLLMTTAGCASLPLFGESSPEEQKKAQLSKDDLWNQTQALEKEKAAYQKRLAEQQAELTRLTQDLSDQQAEIAQANKQVTALNRSVEDLNLQMRLLQEAQQRERPLKEVELLPAKKDKPKPAKKTPPPKRAVRKPPAKGEEQEQDQKPADTSAVMKQITEAKQKLASGKPDAAASPRKKEPEKLPEKAAEVKPEAKPEAKPQAQAAKGRDVPSLDDLALQMKLFEEGGQGQGAAKEPPPAPAKKEALTEEKPAAGTKQASPAAPAAAKPRPQSLKVKVLAGDGNLASAKALSAKLGKMGYRVQSVDKAPRSDFDATVVFYGSDHRAAGEAMAKRLGSGTAARPLTWSSSFDLIVVSGRRN